METIRCYMCDQPGDTVEHVPPRALFPESRDACGIDYRKNLITVPACALHNSGKAADDEFLMASLVGIAGNNVVGFRHKFAKVQRAMHRSSDALLDKVFVKREVVKRLRTEGNTFDLLWGHPDTDRLIRCFERIARGLYYHHFNEPLSGSAFIRVMLGFVVPLDPNALTFQQFIRKKAEQELAGKSSYGSNPEVFYYQVSDSDQFGYFVFFLRFYGGVDVIVAINPAGASPPPNLVMELINGGIKTRIALGDHNFEFN